MSAGAASVHATAVKVGETAILIRGPSGSGKSRLALDLILAGRAGQIPSAVLVGDDRVHLATCGKEIWARPAAALAGLIEIRGVGIRTCDFVSEAPIGLVVDLMADDAARLPAPDAVKCELHGVWLPRIPIGEGFLPFPMVAAYLITAECSFSSNLSANCVKGIGNHITPTIATD